MNGGTYHGMLSGLGPFQEYMPKGKPEANSNSVSRLGKSVLPQACFINHIPPYAFTLISLGPSHEHTVINTLQSKGTKSSVNNLYGKLLCLKHQLINSQKHHQCFKTSIAFTSHKCESWTVEFTWLAHGHQGKSMSEETKASKAAAQLCPTLPVRSQVWGTIWWENRTSLLLRAFNKHLWGVQTQFYLQIPYNDGCYLEFWA